MDSLGVVDEYGDIKIPDAADHKDQNTSGVPVFFTQDFYLGRSFVTCSKQP
jgi:hypothetical protein